MKKLIWILLLLVEPAMMTRAQEPLDNYLVVAAENNAGLRAEFNNYLAALEKAPQVGTLPDPQLMFGYFISPVETRIGPQQARVSLSQRFPWFGTLGAARDAAELKAEAAYQAFQDEKARLFLDVRSAYYELYYLKRSKEITRENLEILNSFRNIVINRIEAGKASAVDEMRLSIEIAEMEDHLVLLADRYQALMEKFLNLLNNDEPINIVLPDTLAPAMILLSKEDVMDSITRNNPSLKRLDYLAESFTADEELSGKRGLPGFSVGADYIFVGDSRTEVPGEFTSGKDAIIFPQVGISLPLYRSKYKAMANEASHKRESSMLQKEERVNDLETMLEEAWKDHNDATRRIELYKNNTYLASSALNILESEYISDRGDFEEILRMERKLLLYSVELEKARADQHSTLAFLNYLIGK